MRRSPPALSCLLGMDLRKRPRSDLTPEEPPPEEPEAQCVIALVVGGTPSCEPIVCKNDNPEGACEK